MYAATFGSIDLELISSISEIDPDGVQNPSQLDALRRYHMWRAMTAQMIFRTDTDEKEQDEWTRFENDLIQDHFGRVATVLEISMEGQFEISLRQIFRKALNLDRELSRQVAVVHWVFQDAKDHASAGAPDGGAHQDRASQNPQDGVHVIVAPGVTKRGKSSGEDFGEVITLVPAEIVVMRTCFQRKVGARGVLCR